MEELPAACPGLEWRVPRRRGAVGVTVLVAAVRGTVLVTVVVTVITVRVTMIVTVLVTVVSVVAVSVAVVAVGVTMTMPAARGPGSCTHEPPRVAADEP